MQRNLRTPHYTNTFLENVEIPIVDPYHQYFVTNTNTTNLKPLIDFSLILNADKTLNPVIYLDNLQVEITISTVILSYQIYNNTTLTYTFSYTSITNVNEYLFIRNDSTFRFYVNGVETDRVELYYVFDTNWSFVLSNVISAKLYNTVIDSYNLELTNLLTVNTDPTSYLELITSQFDPVDEISGRYINYRNTYSPLSETFRFAEIDVFDNEFTLRFTVVDYLSIGAIIRLNRNDFNFTYRNNQINRVPFVSRGYDYYELCNRRGFIKLFVNGYLLIETFLSSRYIFTITLERIEFGDIEIVKGVYTNNHIPVRMSKVIRRDNNHETDKIHFKSVNNYPRHDISIFRTNSNLDLEPNTSKAINLNSIFEPTPAESSISQDSALLSITLGDKITNTVPLTVFVDEHFDPLVIPKKFSYQTNLENHIVTVFNSDPRASVFLWDIRQLNYFVDGYFPEHLISRTMLNRSVVIPNFIDDISLPKAVQLTNATEIEITEPIPNVFSFLLIYKEIESVNNRGYLGNSNNAVVNGGNNGEVIGDVKLSETDYFNIKNFTGIQSNNVTISPNGNSIAIADYLNDLIQVYEKVNNNYVLKFVINRNNAETALGFALSVKVNFITENLLILALKDATSDGRGRLQIWEKQNDIWSRTLNLNSPSLTEQGFGMSSDLDLVNQRLYVGELSTDITYVYQVNSSVPLTTLVGGHYVEVGTKYVFVRDSENVLRIYDKNNYTLIQTLFGVNRLTVSKSVNRFVIASFTDNLVRVYNDLTILTVISPPVPDGEFGFDLSLALNNNLAISSPNTNSVYVYQNSDNYLTRILFRETVSFYGYSIQLQNNYLIISNFNTTVYLYSNDPQFIGTNVNNVFLNGVLVDNNALLNSHPLDIDFIHVNLKAPHNIQYIGRTNTNLRLNGYVLGLLTFSRNLTQPEILAVQDSVLKYLKMKDYYDYISTSS